MFDIFAYGVYIFVQYNKTCFKHKALSLGLLQKYSLIDKECLGDRPVGDHCITHNSHWMKGSSIRGSFVKSPNLNLNIDTRRLRYVS